MLNGALPAFDVDGGPLLVAARALWVMALLSAFGALVFQAVIAPQAWRRMPADAAAVLARRVDRLIQVSLMAAIGSGAAWSVLVARDMAGAATASQATVSQALAALADVALHTAFGQVVMLQLALVAVALGLVRVRRWWALATCSIATALQAQHGHAGSMAGGVGWLLLAAGIAHLGGAGAWLGGLLPLLIAVQTAPAKAAAMAARQFSPMGKLCIAALAASIVVQGWVLIGTVPGLVGTAYGWMAVAKLGLFGALLGFAALNRYRLAPALPTRPSARSALVLSLALQTAAGVAVLAAAGVLSSLPPSMHVQPVWPFTQRFSLDTLAEDDDFRREAIAAALALGAAAALLAAALARRRLRWAATALAGTVAWFAVPHLDLLLVEAYPTSYVVAPTASAAAIVQGAALFPAHCAACHGVDGQGDGPAAVALAVPPANLTADHLWMHSDGELFWWLSHGIAGPDGGLVMPGFAGTLREDERWALIDAVRARNAGWAHRSTGGWPMPVQAPQFLATCGGRAVALSDLRGRPVRLVIGAISAAAAGLTTISASDAATDATGCATSDPAVPAAYALIAGIDAALPGTQFLIDGAGWLRAVQRPGDARWDDPAVLAAAIHDIDAHPIKPAGPAMLMQM